MSQIFSAPVIVAMFGGLTVNLLNMVELLNVPKDRRPFKDLLYWACFCIWPILGGVLGYMYNETASIGKLVAFHIGLSAPLILRTMASVLPAQFKPLPPGA